MNERFDPAGRENIFEATQEIENTVVFVGSALSFSELTVRMFSEAFASVRALRVSTLKDLHLFMQFQDEPTMVIVDQPFWSDIEGALNNIEQICGDARIVLSYSDPKIALQMLQSRRAAPELSGIGFLPMERRLDTWLAISGLLLGGENYLPPEFLDAVVPHDDNSVSRKVQDQTSAKEPACSISKAANNKSLTEREIEVLGMVAQGKQNKIIACDLGVSEHTVKLHIHHVIHKLGVNNRTAASAWYLAKYGAEVGNPQMPHG